MDADFIARAGFLGSPPHVHDAVDLRRVGGTPRHGLAPRHLVDQHVQGAAANALPGAVPEELREERRARFMQVQASISREKLGRKVGRTMDVLVDEVKGRAAVARSAADAPEIDGVVRVRGTPQGTRSGDRIRVRITGSDEHDLQATCDTVSAPASSISA